jgi:hypothetical protein
MGLIGPLTYDHLRGHAPAVGQYEHVVRAHPQYDEDNQGVQLGEIRDLRGGLEGCW